MSRTCFPDSAHAKYSQYGGKYGRNGDQNLNKSFLARNVQMLFKINPEYNLFIDSLL